MNKMRKPASNSGRTWVGKTWAGKTWVGKTWAGKTWAGKTWAGKTWAGSEVPGPTQGKAREARGAFGLRFKTAHLSEGCGCLRCKIPGPTTQIVLETDYSPVTTENTPSWSYQRYQRNRETEPSSSVGPRKDPIRNQQSARFRRTSVRPGTSLHTWGGCFYAAENREPGWGSK
jgi:hypothetical protein